MTPSLSIAIRRAHDTDVDTIASFSAAMALETEGRRLDIERLRHGTLTLLRTPAFGFFQVAERLDLPSPIIVGQLMVTYEWSDWRNGLFWWIQSVYVDPPWRRQGLFRRMHESVLAAARERAEVCGIRLYVDAANHIAQRAYRRVGLEPTSYAMYEHDFHLPHRRPLHDRPHEA